MFRQRIVMTRNSWQRRIDSHLLAYCDRSFHCAFTLLGDVAAFAPGGHMLTVGSEDGIEIYNASNGLLNSSIERISCMDYIRCSAALTADGSGVGVGLQDQYLLPRGNRNVSYQIE